MTQSKPNDDEKLHPRWERFGWSASEFSQLKWTVPAGPRGKLARKLLRNSNKPPPTKP